MAVIGFSDALRIVHKFDDDEPRVPAGSSGGGEWTSGGGGDAALGEAGGDAGGSGPHPVFKPLNSACVKIANKMFPAGFDVSADAPNTYEDLVKRVHDTGRMTVWNGGSDKTIFDDPKANYAFRAWHDACHLRGQHNFTPEGEEGAYEEMVKDVRAEYGHTPEADKMCGLLHEEIIGQLEYTKNHGGVFPVNQKAFAIAYLKTPDAAVHADFSKQLKSGAADPYGWGRLRDVHAGTAQQPRSFLSGVVARQLQVSHFGKAYDPDQPRDQDGRWASDGSAGSSDHHGGAAFASPSITDKDFTGAVHALGSPRQRAFLEAGHEIDSSLGVSGHQLGVVGAWADGAENSTMIEAARAEPTALRLSAAMKGALGRQKAVLVFTHDEAGPAAMYDFTVPTAPAETHGGLLKAGIAHHTLIPSGSGTRVLVVDLDGSMGHNLDGFADAHGVRGVRTYGRAEFIGDEEGSGSDAEQRGRALQAYERVIQTSEAEKFHGRTAGEIWGRVRDRWAGRIQALKRGAALGFAAALAAIKKTVD